MFLAEASSGLGGASNLLDATSYSVSTTATAADNATNLALADAAAVASGKRLWIPYGTYSTTAVTFSSRVVMDTGAILAWSAGVVAFNGGTEFDISKHFSITGTGTATFSTKHTIVGYTEWWGAITNDTAYDTTNVTAINSALVALKKVQLMGATYYHATAINHITGGVNFVGVGGIPYTTVTGNIGFVNGVFTPKSPAYIGGIDATGFTSILCCTSATETCLNIQSKVNSGSSTTGQIAEQLWCSDMFVTRNIAPAISSDCIGVKVQDSLCEIARVVCTESMIGWKFHNCLIMNVTQCKAFRYSAGTGAGTDYWKGFWFDGTAVTGISGGNASLYINQCSAWGHSAGIGTQTGFYFDSGFADLFMDEIETGWVTHGIEIVGSASSSFTFGNFEFDFHLRHFICDGCRSHAIKITNTNLYGSISISEGDANCLSGSPIYIDNSLARLSIFKANISNFTTNTPSIVATNSQRINVSDIHFIEPRAEAIKLTSVNNSSFSGEITNDLSTITTAAGVQLVSNCNRNKFKIKSSGAYTKIGYKVLDAVSGYNEFDCTGIDPAGITGGSANKLVINGTQVTATGIAAAGSGTNVASGVMA